MAVPDTDNFSLEDVTTELGLTGSDKNLTKAFQVAILSFYDPRYATVKTGSRNNLYSFRNYGPLPTTTTKPINLSFWCSRAGSGDIYDCNGDGVDEMVSISDICNFPKTTTFYIPTDKTFETTTEILSPSKEHMSNGSFSDGNIVRIFSNNGVLGTAISCDSGNGSGGDPFIFKVDTRLTDGGATGKNGFKIPISWTRTMDAIVEWGDGSSSHIKSTSDPEINHTYSNPGIYTIKIYKRFDNLYMNVRGYHDKDKIISVESWGIFSVRPVMSYSFSFCRNLTKFPPGGTWINGVIDGTDLMSQVKIGSYPSDVTLSSLTIGYRMFHNNSLTDLPPLITLSKLEDGYFMFYGNTINTTRYSKLLVDMASTNPNNNVKFHGGGSKYNASGATARATLVSRGWEIKDGGRV